MSKPTTLNKLYHMLRDRGVYATFHGPSEFFRSPWRLEWCSRDGSRQFFAESYGENVYVKGTMPLEGAVIATIGPDKSLEDAYPMQKKRMEMGGWNMTVPCDESHVLLTMDQMHHIALDHQRFYQKMQNQKRELRKLHAKTLMQQREIERMEDNALEILVMAMGYSEGE